MRWQPGPALASPISCPASSCFPRRRVANTEHRANTPAVRKLASPRRKQEVADRLGEIRLAAAEGHEIASHGCGHFDGKGWSKADWLKEFSSFKRILGDAYAINGIKASRPTGRASPTASRVSVRPISARVPRSTRRWGRRVFATTQAAFPEVRRGRIRKETSSVSHCRKSRKDRRRGGSSPWTTICSCAIRAGSSVRTRRQRFRSAAMKRSRRHLTRSMKAAARRCSSAFISC